MSEPARRAFRYFPASATSVREARVFLRAFLLHASRAELADQAELALSEVATNAVLHAHTGFQVNVELIGDQVRVEVLDDSPGVPVWRGYGSESTTGRGLELVAALTSQRGVEVLGSGGKAVWFVVAGQGPEPREDELLDAWDDWGIDLDRAAAAGGERTVVLLGLPPTLWLSAREHHDAILRELALYALAHEGSVSERELASADRARAWVSTAVAAAVGHENTLQLPHSGSGPGSAPSQGLSPIDLEVAVGQDAEEAFELLQEVLDTAERLAVAGKLLIPPGLPEIVAVRDWVCEQALVQLAGGSPLAWAGTAQERFLDEVRARSEPHEVEWDVSLVTASPRGVVAADEANRILAVSDVLAQRLGWDPGDLVGRRLVALVPPRLREAHVAGFSRHVRGGQTRILGRPLRLPVLHADGREIECDVLIELAPVQGGRCVYLGWITPPEVDAGG